MKTSKNIKDFKSAKKDIEKEMVNKILDYLKNGIFPSNNIGSQMNAYTIVQVLSDQGDNQSKELLNYYNQIIENYIIDCKKDLSRENNANLIDGFLHHTDHIYTLIYWMYKVFMYLDRFYTKAKGKITLSKFAMMKYSSLFFEEFKIDVFQEVNKLIKEERNGNLESRAKIKGVMKILKDLDIEFPQIMKDWMKNMKEKANILILYSIIK